MTSLCPTLSFSHQIFIAYLLCARYYSRHWRHSAKQTLPCPCGMWYLAQSTFLFLKGKQVTYELDFDNCIRQFIRLKQYSTCMNLRVKVSLNSAPQTPQLSLPSPSHEVHRYPRWNHSMHKGKTLDIIQKMMNNLVWLKYRIHKVGEVARDFALNEVRLQLPSTENW